MCLINKLKKLQRGNDSLLNGIFIHVIYIKILQNKLFNKNAGVQTTN
jgi:hypothetical protein